MPATTPSPQKRPSLAERSSSTHSLSSSGRPANANANANKAHRTHVVTKHARNVSHGKGLNKLGKVSSTTNVAAEGKAHQRKKSGPVTPTESPRTSVVSNVKRNSSHAAMPKNTSHANLRKNLSAGALASKRNRSHGALMKSGAAPQKSKDADTKQGFFALGDQSSEDDDDEEEWEDSTTQSPELSRNQSKASTPLRPRTPNGDAQKPPDQEPDESRQTLDPPGPTIGTTNVKPLSNLRQVMTENAPADPALLQNKPRSTVAPPAMSTFSAQAGLNDVHRSDSARSLTMASQSNDKISGFSGTTTAVGTVSSGSASVSHFLPSTSVATSAKTFDTGSDDESISGSMAKSRSQPSDSPEKPRSLLNKIQSGALPSRTNQKMELQRRETMRAAAAATANPGAGNLGLSASGASLHSRSGSKAGVRNRSVAGEMKALKQDYETAIKQLTVIRRFRNPVLESLQRLQENDVISSDPAVRAQTSSQTKSRPQSRRDASTTATPKHAIARSPEDTKLAHPQDSRSNGPARQGRVQFQLSRQGSHDDIGLTTSQGSPGEFEEEQDGISPEEALIRRIWESRVVYDNDGVQTAA